MTGRAGQASAAVRAPGVPERGTYRGGEPSRARRVAPRLTTQMLISTMSTPPTNHPTDPPAR